MKVLKAIGIGFVALVLIGAISDIVEEANEPVKPQVEEKVRVAPTKDYNDGSKIELKNLLAKAGVNNFEYYPSSNYVYSAQVDSDIWSIYNYNDKKRLISFVSIYSNMHVGKPKNDRPHSFTLIDSQSGKELGGFSTWKGIYINTD